MFISYHGVPTQITTDSRTEFTNRELQEMLRLHKIESHLCTPRHPQSNGMIERVHSTIIEHIRILKQQLPKEPIIRLMRYAVIFYNNSIHSVTKFKPEELINGHVNHYILT